MVSQPEPEPSPQLSSRRRGLYSASSVVSRPALSRTRRYNRSHAGGSSLVPQNEFPVFSHSGDVDILVTAGPLGSRYLLHRDTLARCSGFFEASTSSEWSRAQPLLAGGNEVARVAEEPAASPKRQWAYELDSGAGAGDIPMLVQKGTSVPDRTSIFGAASKSDARSKLTSPSPNHVSFSRSFTHLGTVTTLAAPDQDLLRDYDNLFRIFYNYPPVLDGVNVADAYVQCKSLLALADQYDALGVVGPRVDHHLQFQSRLWKQIAKYPVSYLRLGYLARSKVIFQEALIHVVGQWPVGERSLRAALPETVLDIIEDKVDELEETVSRVEGRLFRLNLTTARGDRVTPFNNYLDWLVMSLFRQWLADNTTPQPPASRSARPRSSSLPPPPVVCLGCAYRTLCSESPGAFLGHNECKRFLKLTPELYGRENLLRFEKRMDELKTLARDVVRPLLGSRLELDVGDSGRASEGIGYLTCTTVGNRDLPWPVEG